MQGSLWLSSSWTRAVAGDLALIRSLHGKQLQASTSSADGRTQDLSAHIAVHIRDRVLSLSSSSQALVTLGATPMAGPGPTVPSFLSPSPRPLLSLLFKMTGGFQMGLIQSSPPPT